MRQRKNSELTRAELEVMRVLWARERAFVSELLDDMPEPKPAYNTVSTVVRILERKGVVGHEPFGKSHRYYPLVGREEYTQTVMRNVVTHFFDNSVSQMFSFLTDREDYSLAEIERIARIAEKAIESKQ